MKLFIGLWLVGVSACVSAPPAVEGMSLASFSAECGTQPSYSALNTLVIAECPLKPDEWVVSDGMRVTRVMPTADFLPFAQAQVCGADKKCATQLAINIQQGVALKQEYLRKLNALEAQKAGEGFAAGFAGAVQQPLASSPVQQPNYAPPSYTNCRTYKLGNVVQTDCSTS